MATISIKDIQRIREELRGNEVPKWKCPSCSAVFYLPVGAVEPGGPFCREDGVRLERVVETSLPKTELWPKVRMEMCCKCPTSFQTEEANSYTAIASNRNGPSRSTEGWAVGQDVDGCEVVYCPAHAMPRVEWGSEMIFVRADDSLHAQAPNEALASYDVSRSSGGFMVRVVAPGFEFVVCDKPAIFDGPGCAAYICFFDSEDYARRVGQAALRCYLATKDDWRKGKVESRLRRLEEINERLWKVVSENPGLLAKLAGR